MEKHRNKLCSCGPFSKELNWATKMKNQVEQLKIFSIRGIFFLSAARLQSNSRKNWPILKEVCTKILMLWEWGSRQTFTSPWRRYLYPHVCLPMEGYHNYRYTHTLTQKCNLPTWAKSNRATSLFTAALFVIDWKPPTYPSAGDCEISYCTQEHQTGIERLKKHLVNTCPR